MSDADAFLRSILDAPDDDTPRLVFADWLDEHNDPARAEFIRLQCEAARLPSFDPRLPAMNLRQRVLLNQFGAKWAEPVQGLAASWAFRRGFIESVRVSAASLNQVGADLFGRVPVRKLRLYGTPRVVTEACGHPLLARLAILDLSFNDLGPEVAAVLARTPTLNRLQQLNLSVNHIGDAGARSLAGSAVLADLVLLDVTYNDLSEAARDILRKRYHQHLRADD